MDRVALQRDCSSSFSGGTSIWLVFEPVCLIFFPFSNPIFFVSFVVGRSPCAIEGYRAEFFSSGRRIPRRYLIPIGLIVVGVPTHDNSGILDELSMEG